MSHWRTRFNTERPQKGWERALTEYTIRSGIKLMKGMAVQSQPQPTRWNCSLVTLFLRWTCSLSVSTKNLNLHQAPRRVRSVNNRACPHFFPRTHQLTLISTPVHSCTAFETSIREPLTFNYPPSRLPTHLTSPT